MIRLSSLRSSARAGCRSGRPASAPAPAASSGARFAQSHHTASSAQPGSMPSQSGLGSLPQSFSGIGGFSSASSLRANVPESMSKAVARSAILSCTAINGSDCPFDDL
ncbi:uncharacterized protein BJ171DRAFT_566782 [Polychytrium aggregatum]|uniref:uncharacterized protein n=1 Tax=Polychytrium aggregatum TaxID=110093 RepID=UPI0022FDE018|nr:uncharacterized protein BJ171DRAFT_566782 [Polychytrium aggregatum]KAI9206456.1 hypothetical protein BJ171DRAFT_566782 [Polychytrium aggregatum]